MIAARVDDGGGDDCGDRRRRRRRRDAGEHASARRGRPHASPAPVEQRQPSQPTSRDGGPHRSRSDRDVKTTTSLTLTRTPDQVQAVSDRAIRVVDSLGGSCRAPRSTPRGSHADAMLSLRIPPGSSTRASRACPSSPTSTARSQQTEDLTDQRELLEARVRDARADRAGLRARLAKATTDKERSRLRAQLDRATRRVTRPQREVASLGQQAYADVDLLHRAPSVRRRRYQAATAGPRRRSRRRGPRAPGHRRRADDRLAILFPLAVIGLDRADHLLPVAC